MGGIVCTQESPSLQLIIVNQEDCDHVSEMIRITKSLLSFRFDISRAPLFTDLIVCIM